ncbi:MAG: hypothetical protein JWM47_1311 [Acidimicrobiales bacterium]|nr:hypothetical protein [Acidimicrobiales bacterium]
MARRSKGRHARTRRTTPRRWLPFVALLAVVAGGVVLSNRATGPSTTEAERRSLASLLPVAARSDALSTAWYCSGGSARGAEGPAELSVVIANADDAGITADVRAYGADGTQEQAFVRVPAAGRTRVVASDLLTTDWVTLSIEVLGGHATVERELVGPHGIDASPCSNRASDQWLIPSGSTAIGATEDLFLFNPFPDATSVDITFATDDGPKSPRSLQGVVVPGHSLRVVPSAELPARRPEIATTVRARTGRVVVDRLQTYDGKGDVVPGADDAPDFPPPRGLAATAAIPAPTLRWLFPDARNDDGTRTEVAVYNPGRREARLELVVSYEDPDRRVPVDPLEVVVRPREQVLVDLSATSGVEPGVGYSIDLRSLGDVPVAAELLRFGAAPPVADVAPTDPTDGETVEATPDAGVAPAEPIDGFAVVPGSPVAARGWFLASRGASSARAATVVVANPGSATVTVHVDAIAQGRRSRIGGATVRVPPGDRRTLDLSEGSLNPALVVTATGPVVVDHSAVVLAGLGISQALATPLPETVTEIPPPRR